MPTTPEHPATRDSLELCRWHIDRYDRLRGAVAVRSSVVLSANALLFAGAVVLASRYADGRPWVVLAVLAPTVLALGSVLYCLRALVSIRGDRAVYGLDLDRGTFGWSRTIRDYPIGRDGVDSFVAQFASANYDDLLHQASLELWVGIHQHAMRYRALRNAIIWLRAATFAFGAFLAAVALAINT